MPLQGYNAYTYNNSFRRGEFHHVVFCISGNIHSLYLDGSMVLQNQNSGNVFTWYNNITTTVIGANSSLKNPFKGNIDDVRVYNKVLLPTQVFDLYFDRNLVLYYPFDNLVNKRTPNYATLQYDASFLGQSSITTNSMNGSGALSVSNTQNVAATQYVYAKVSFGQTCQMDSRKGFTIGCWINTTGIANRIQRIFDIPVGSGAQGLGVDISGTNMIYSIHTPLLKTAMLYYPLDVDVRNLGIYKNAVLDTPGGDLSFNTVLSKSALRATVKYAFWLRYINLNSNSYTICVWLYRSNTLGQAVYPFSTSDNVGSVGFNTIAYDYTTSNSVAIYYKDGNRVTVTDTTNAWTHYGIVIDGINATETIYINSTAKTPDTPISIVPLINPITLIKFISYNNNLPDSDKVGGADSNTYMRQLCVFNYALTSVQVSSIYTSTS